MSDRDKQVRGAMSPSEITRVLWNWNVKTYALSDKIAAAVAGDFDVLTVPYAVYRAYVDTGGSANAMLSMADSAGIRLDFLDGITSWGSTRFPAGNKLLEQAFDYSAEDGLRACEELGLKRIVAVSGFDRAATPPKAQIVDEFGAFCEQAAKRGMWVDLEPMAMMGLNTLAFAWEIVKEAGCSNSGVAFDTWHFFRTDRDYEVLRSIPRNRLRNVQVVDGHHQPVGSGIWDDVFARMLPGDGELPLVEILEILRDYHDVEFVGPEAILAELDTLAPDELGRRAARTTDKVLAEAGFRTNVPAGQSPTPTAESC